MDGRLSYITRQAFLDELQKISAPRWVKEMRRTGDYAPAQLEGAPLGPIGKQVSKAKAAQLRRA